MKIKTKVTPWLGFNSQAEEAAAFYTSIIPGSQVTKIVRNPENNEVMVVEFELGGLPVFALNVGQDWNFTTAFSFSVACESQDEIDRLWDALSEGGEELECGWLTDKFGLSWQIVPEGIMEWISSSDPERAQRVFSAVCKMVKLDMATLKAAYEGDA